MQKVVDEYDQTMASIIAQTKTSREDDVKRISALTNENQRLVAEAREVDRSFRDLRERYDNVKAIVDSYKKNEDILRHTVTSLQEEHGNGQKRYDALKAHAEEKINAYVV